MPHNSCLVLLLSCLLLSSLPRSLPSHKFHSSQRSHRMSNPEWLFQLQFLQFYHLNGKSSSEGFDPRYLFKKRNGSWSSNVSAVSFLTSLLWPQSFKMLTKILCIRQVISSDAAWMARCATYRKVLQVKICDMQKFRQKPAMVEKGHWG